MDLEKVALQAYEDEWEKIARVFMSAGRMRAAASGAGGSHALQKVIDRLAKAKALKKLAPTASGAELQQYSKALDLQKSLGPKGLPVPPPTKPLRGRRPPALTR